MKKIYIIGFIMLLVGSRSYSQTLLPFYGFELSNYEVGDTIEYYTYYWNGPPGLHIQTGKSIYRVINKEPIDVDTEKFTIETSYWDTTAGAFIPAFYGKDTMQLLITNDTIYNNNNNLLGQHLQSVDSIAGNMIEYDTVAGLKHLSVVAKSMLGSEAEFDYEAKENLGIILFRKPWEGVPPFYTDSLIFAHLSHYGVYGRYQSIPLGTIQFSPPEFQAFIFYNRDMNIYLNINYSDYLKPVLSVFNIVGQQVTTLNVNKGINSVNMHNLPQGIYFYKVTSNGNVLGQGKLMNL